MNQLISDQMAQTLLILCLIFWLQSSMLIFGIWLLQKKLQPSLRKLRATLWKSVAVLAILTTAIGFFTELIPNVWHIQLPAKTQAFTQPTNISDQVTSEPMVAQAAKSSLEPFFLNPTEAGQKEALEQAAPNPTVPFKPTPLSFSQWLVLFWWLGSGFLLMRLLIRIYRFQNLLKNRRQLTQGHLFRRFQELTHKQTKSNGLKVSVSPNLKVPIAFGIWKPEICIPDQALDTLNHAQMDALLCHEIAHHVGKDPRTLLCMHILEAIFFFQPLFKLARKEWEFLSELRCDDWAVSKLGTPIALASCLTQVASWSLKINHKLPVPGMIKGGSILETRVKRLLKKDHNKIQKANWFAKLLLIGGLGFVAMAGPGIQKSTLLTNELTPPEPSPLQERTTPTQLVNSLIPELGKSQVSAVKLTNTQIILAGPAPKKTTSIQVDWFDTEKFEETRELEIEAPKTLAVDGGINGGIAVKGWNRNEVKIVAKVWVRADDSDEAEKLFSKIDVVVDDKIYADGPRKSSWGVSFKIYAPVNTNVELKTHNGGISLSNLNGRMRFEALNGGISLKNLAGDVQGHATNGGLNIKLNDSTWRGKGLDVETVNGGASIAIPEDYNAELVAGTTNGRINFRFPITVQGNISKRLNTTLGKGGPQVRIVTTNGGVVFKR